MDRKSFIQSDPQVIIQPTIYSSGSQLTVECFECNESCILCLNHYYRRRRLGNWICFKCLKPKLTEQSKNNPLYKDSSYQDKFRKLHEDPEYHSKVHNEEVNEKIAKSTKSVWEDPN